MHSRDARDAMTDRVNAAFARWPTLDDMPDAKGDVRVKVKVTPDEFGDPVVTQESYVKALFACAYQDAEPVGRDGQFIVGKRAGG